MRKTKFLASLCVATALVATASPLTAPMNEEVSAKSWKHFENVDNRTTTLSDVEVSILLKAAQKKILKQYGHDYKFDNFRAIFIDAEDTPNCVDFDIITDMTLVKHPSKSSYYLGMLEEANKLTDECEKYIAQDAIDAYLDDQMELYNVADETTFCYRIQVPSLPSSQIANTFTTMSTNDALSEDYILYDRTDLDDEVLLAEVNETAMTSDDASQKVEGMQAVQTAITDAYNDDDVIHPMAVSYSATSAVNYAYNHAKDVPEFSKANGMGSDCANFVSKCICAGGIPEDKTGKWYRAPQAGSYAGVNWMRTGYYTDSNGQKTGVKTYMVDTKKYFVKAASSSAAKKGGFMFWNAKSHVALVYSNSNGVIKYSQHSNVQMTVITKTYANENVTFYNPNL